VKRPRGYTIWLATLLSIVIAGLVLAQTGQLPQVEGGILRLLVPVQNWFSSVGHSASDIVQTTRDLRDLRQRNQQLTELVNQLAVENIRLKETEADYETLGRLLGFAEAESNATREFKAVEVRARVIGREPSNLLQYIIIAVGAQDGMEIGMPAVTENGLVGRIEVVFPTASRVRLITDADSSVNVLVQRTRATGVVKGQAGGRLILDYLPQGEDVVSVGDIILTSGLGGGFPRQLVVGQVVSVQQKDYELFQTAEVRPTVDFDRLEIVLVITNFVPLALETDTP
jgi:rod shape-determining protein MreC